MEYFFQHKDISLFYRKIGKGNRVLIAFHGFTKSSRDFIPFEDFCKEKYTIYAVDLFYHGKTTFKSRKWRSFTKPQLKEIFECFLKNLNVDKFEVLGYSMGGRVALFLLEQFGQKINHLYLFAPDGLKINFWNWFVTSTLAGKRIYGLTISNPGIVHLMSRAGQKLNLLPNTMNKFLKTNLQTKGMRLRIYRVWQLYRFITFKQKKLKDTILKNNLKVDLVVGQKDPVVDSKMVKGFADFVGPNVKLHIIKAGHDLFRPHVLEYLKIHLF